MNQSRMNASRYEPNKRQEKMKRYSELSLSLSLQSIRLLVECSRMHLQDMTDYIYNNNRPSPSKFLWRPVFYTAVDTMAIFHNV